MNFLQPQFLYGLFALSIPIIVHLFNFRKAKKVYFTNTAFLQQVQQTSSAKRKLKHYLILLSRLLALFFLVMAFTQPFIPSSEEGLQNSHVVIYLDNSQSMSNLTNEEIRGLDEGVAYVNELVALYPKETQYLFVTNDFLPFSNTFKSGDKIVDRMTELSLSNSIRSFPEISRRINSTTLANNVFDFDAYWVSDFQKSTMGQIEKITNDTTIAHNLLPISFTSIANLFIDSVYIEDPFDIEVNKSKVNVVMKNSGKQPITDAVLRLYLNDQQISSKSIDLEGNSSSVVNFDVVYQFEDQNNARFSLEDYPITFDNEFYFNLNAQQSLKIIEIRGATDVLAIENVYANTTLFDFQMMPEGNINYAQLADTDLIVLNELTKLTPSLANQLFEYKKSGGKIVIIPSETIVADEYSILVGTSITSVKEDESQPKLSLQMLDLKNPFYANIFESEAANFSMPVVKNAITWARLQSLMKINSGEPFLSYHEDQGVSYLFSSPLSTEYTDLTQHAIFVPIMYKLASHNSNSRTTLYQNLNQQNISIELDSVINNSIYKLRQTEQELIPNQITSGNQLLLEVPKNKLTAGFTDLTLNGQVEQVIAFNNDRQESIPDQLSSDDLATIVNRNTQLKLLNTTDSGNFTREMQDRYQGLHLWKYAIVFALLFLFIEMLIIRFYKPTAS